MSWFVDCCDCRTANKKPPGGSDTPSGKGSGEQRVGIGITFEEGKDGELMIKKLAPGGPAELSGKAEVGDVLFEVDGTNVYTTDPKQIGPILLGSEGTAVELRFKRPSTGELVKLNLVRGPAKPARGFPG
mmetsp:Transcript_11373/g.27888  ORF Transcript_11373/g.27888 Transcript_11373/m.27888 type:complete len:130 (+) Transcript_11373:27-416(+)